MELIPKKCAFLMWLVVTAFVGLVLGPVVIPQLIHEYNLSLSYEQTVGEITATNPEMHNGCTYQYVVDKKEYAHGGGTCGHETIGEKISIYYSPTNPADSMNFKPRGAFYNDLIPFGVTLVLFPLLGAYSTYKRVQKRGKK